MECIPTKLKRELKDDPYYQTCCLTGITSKEDKIDFAHVFHYGKKRIQEKWNILPIVWYKHRREGDSDSFHNGGIYKELAQLKALERVNIKYLNENYPKKSWSQIKAFLMEKLK